jgi:putative methionine-R-sulfoxide reductase with GAF domain
MNQIDTSSTTNSFKPFTSLQVWFNRLDYSRKFVIIAMVFTIPLFALSPLALEQSSRIDKFGYQEVYGTQYLRLTQNLIDGVLDSQFISVQYSHGSVDISEIENSQTIVDAAIASIEAFRNNDQDARSFEDQLITDVENIKTEWQLLKSDLPNLSEKQIIERHNILITKIFDLKVQVGNLSNLILDPELNTYYLMSNVLISLPEINQSIHQTLLLVEQAIYYKTLSTEEKNQLVLFIGSLTKDLENINQNTELSISNDSTQAIAPLVSQPLQNYNQVANSFIEIIQTKLIDSPNVSITEAEFIAIVNELENAQNELYSASSTALEGAIQTRLNSLAGSFYGSILIAFLSIAVAFGVGISIMNSISRPLTELTKAARKLANGELNTRVQIINDDEVGQASVAFNQMAQELEARNKALTVSTEVSRRISTILEPNQLLAEIMEQLKTTFSYYHAHIYLINEDELVMAAGTGEVGQALLARKHKIQKGKGLVGRAAERNQFVLVGNTLKDPNWLPNDLLPETKSEIAVPISIGSQVLGVLDVQQNYVDALTREDSNLLQTLAYQIAIALRNAQTYSQTQQIAERESLINEISRKIQNTATIEQALQVTARELGSALGAKDARVLLSLPDTQAN